ncbi:MAG: hypothetical protein HQL87_02845 [Magnetococcales bacterium]|nr:hypothetical protein [Magnetococcales bacterium]
MNAISRKFLLISMDLVLSLFFLVIILVAALDFNSRLQHEEQQVHSGGQGTSAGWVAHPAPGKNATATLSTPMDKGRTEIQALGEKNAALTEEVHKKTAEARKLLEDNMALLGQNASLLARLNQEEGHPKAPSAPTAPGNTTATTPPTLASTEATLRAENASLVTQLAQMDATLQTLYQQQAAQSDTPRPPPSTAGHPPATQTAAAGPGGTGGTEKKTGAGFWDNMVATFQDTAQTPPPPSTPQEVVTPPVEKPRNGASPPLSAPARPETPTVAEKSGKETKTGTGDKETKAATAASTPSPDQGEIRSAVTTAGKESQTITPTPVPPAGKGAAYPGNTAPVVKVEKGMVGPGVLDKMATVLQESPLPSPATAPVTQTATVPVAPPAADQGSLVRATPSTPAEQKNSRAATGEAGFWEKMVHTFRESPKTPPATTTATASPAPAEKPAAGAAVPPAPAAKPAVVAAAPSATVDKPPAKSSEKGSSTAATASVPEPSTPVTTGPATARPVDASSKEKEGLWEELLTSFQGGPAPDPAHREALPDGPPSPGGTVSPAQKPPPAGTTVAALAPAHPGMTTPDKPRTPSTTSPPPVPEANVPTGGVRPAVTGTVPPVPTGKTLPPDQAKVVLESVTDGTHRTLVSTADIVATRKQLLHQIQDDLKQHHIPAEINEREGTLYLPGLLDFKGDVPEAGLEKRPGIRELATVLARRLPCFTRQSGPVPGCGELPAAVKLDALVIAGNSGSAPVGSSAFRHNWNLANARALQTFAELLEAYPSLNGIRNTQEQSLFRLDGFLPPEGRDAASTPARPLRRVELRFIMGPASPTARPQQ